MHPVSIHRKMVFMGRGAVLVAVLLAAVSLSGCGAPSLATAIPTPAGGFTTPSPATTAVGATFGDQTADAGPTFPLTVRRTGGIANFHDTVVLRANGTLTVDTDELAGRTCTLAKADIAPLVGALSTLQLGGPGPEAPQPADTNSNPIMLTVTDAHDRPVDLDGPSLGEIRSSLSALVSDVTLIAPTSTKCTTPSTSPAP